MNDQKLKWRYRTALPLFLTVVAGLCAGPLFADAPETQLPSKPSSGGAVDSNHAENGSHSAASPEVKEHGLTQEAVDIARVFGLPITNSMFVTWLTAIGLIVFAQIATRNMKLVPAGAQNFCEWLVETLYDFLQESLAGTWSSGRSGSLPRSSSSFSPRIGSASFPGRTPLGGGIGPPRVSGLTNRFFAGPPPT